MEDSFNLPSFVNKGWVIKSKTDRGSRYDFQYIDRDGYRINIDGLSRSFDIEYWNYAKLISGVFRHNIHINFVVDLIYDITIYDVIIISYYFGSTGALI